MADELKNFMTQLACSVDRLSEFIADPRGVAERAGLDEEARNALFSGDQMRIYTAIGGIIPTPPQPQQQPAAAAQPQPQAQAQPPQPNAPPVVLYYQAQSSYGWPTYPLLVYGSGYGR